MHYGGLILFQRKNLNLHLKSYSKHWLTYLQNWVNFLQEVIYSQ